MEIQTWIGAIFGVGGVGAITVVVTAYRRLKTGQLSDEESVIKRLHRELTRADTETVAAQRRAEVETTLKNFWREQAVEYRLQVISLGGQPQDMVPPNVEAYQKMMEDHPNNPEKSS